MVDFTVQVLLGWDEMRGFRLEFDGSVTFCFLLHRNTLSCSRSGENCVEEIT